MKKLKSIIIISVALFFSCSGDYDKDSYLGEIGDFDLEEEIIPVTRQAGAGTQHPNTESNYYDDKKIIKDARIGFEVEDYTIYRSNLDSLIYIVKGYI